MDIGVRSTKINGGAVFHVIIADVVLSASTSCFSVDSVILLIIICRSIMDICVPDETQYAHSFFQPSNA